MLWCGAAARAWLDSEVNRCSWLQRCSVRQRQQGKVVALWRGLTEKDANVVVEGMTVELGLRCHGTTKR